MSDQYAHGLAADWKQRSAMASASKVGGSYSGWRPTEVSKVTFLGFGFVLIAVGTAAWIITGLGL